MVPRVIYKLSGFECNGVVNFSMRSFKFVDKVGAFFCLKWHYDL